MSLEATVEVLLIHGQYVRWQKKGEAITARVPPVQMMALVLPVALVMLIHSHYVRQIMALILPRMQQMVSTTNLSLSHF